MQLIGELSTSEPPKEFFNLHTHTTLLMRISMHNETVHKNHSQTVRKFGFIFVRYESLLHDNIEWGADIVLALGGEVTKKYCIKTCSLDNFRQTIKHLLQHKHTNICRETFTADTLLQQITFMQMIFRASVLWKFFNSATFCPSVLPLVWSTVQFSPKEKPNAFAYANPFSSFMSCYLFENETNAMHFHRFDQIILNFMDYFIVVWTSRRVLRIYRVAK